MEATPSLSWLCPVAVVLGLGLFVLLLRAVADQCGRCGSLLVTVMPDPKGGRVRSCGSCGHRQKLRETA